MRKFCLLTTGLSGSAALMDHFGSCEDIALPNKNIECRDNELLRWDQLERHVSGYTLLLERLIPDQAGLIDAFFAHNSEVDYAGFKAMPEHFRDFRAFLRRGDICFITLIRQDVPSTVANFMLAREKEIRRREGKEPRDLWIFDPAKADPMRGNIRYLFNSHLALSQVPEAIPLNYEDLCRPNFANKALDDFFGRPVALQNPQPPAVGSTYVDNWQEFNNFVRSEWGQLKEQLGRQVQLRRQQAGSAGE